jgi:hypothetical protein
VVRCHRRVAAAAARSDGRSADHQIHHQYSERDHQQQMNQTFGLSSAENLDSQ